MQKKLPNDSNDGILDLDRIRKISGYPGLEAFNKGAVAVVECDEDIPCNPCESICSRGAITVSEPITNLPKVDPGKCDGCTLCISICPGLCIFVVNKNYNEKESLVFLPYEMNKIPEKGQIIKGCNSKGEPVCEARVEKIIRSKKSNKTTIVGIAVPVDFYEIVRSISF